MKSAKLPKETKTKLIKKYGGKEKNTGQAEVQIALFTERINYLTGHFKEHAKDHHSRQGLLTLINKRRKLLDYLKREDTKRYQEIVKSLDLRK